MAKRNGKNRTMANGTTATLEHTIPVSDVAATLPDSIPETPDSPVATTSEAAPVQVSGETLEAATTTTKALTTPTIPTTKVGWICRAIEVLGLTPENISANGMNNLLIDYIAQHSPYPREGLVNGFSVAKGQALRKMGWTKNVSQASRVIAQAAEPTLAELRAVRECISETPDGLQTLEAAMREVEIYLDITGGMDKLKKCLTLLRELSGR